MDEEKAWSRRVWGWREVGREVERRERRVWGRGWGEIRFR
jgi:hypothetical protein